MEEERQRQYPEYDIIWDMGVRSERDAATMVTADPANAADEYVFPGGKLGSLVWAGV